MIPYIENPKDATRELLELINEFSKLAGYKINTQKSVTFLYTGNKRSERKIKKIIPFLLVLIWLLVARWPMFPWYVNLKKRSKTSLPSIVGCKSFL